jgi:hypothetical protein
VLLALPGLVVAVGRISADEQAAKPAAPPKPAVALHKLPNDDLLKQARGIYDKAAGDYRAQFRALAAAEQLFDEVAEPAARSDGPDKAEPAQVPPVADPTAPAALKGATQAVAAAKKQQEAARARRKLAQPRKDRLNRVATELEAALSAAAAFLKALDDLKPFAVEIGLRLKDGTLAEAAAPRTSNRTPWRRRGLRSRPSRPGCGKWWLRRPPPRPRSASSSRRPTRACSQPTRSSPRHRQNWPASRSGRRSRRPTRVRAPTRSSPI